MPSSYLNETYSMSVLWHYQHLIAVRQHNVVGHSTRYQTDSWCLRIEAGGPNGCPCWVPTALFPEPALAHARHRSLWRSGMAEETENWRYGLKQKFVDEIDHVVKAFRGSSDRIPEGKGACDNDSVDRACF